MSLPSAEIIETLGEGSFGVVYVARLTDGALRRTVVLKVLKPNWAEDPEILTRARDEAALLARLNHDNIVRVEQLTELEGRPTMVMEHVQGLTLDRLISERGPLPVGVAVTVAERVAAALDAAFNRAPPGDQRPLRVVHRDIKPSNIIISASGGVKVLDFGTARANFNAREARTSSLTLGSPLYMAPECFDGGAATPAVDVYALGATLYELVTGKPLGKLSVDPERHAAALAERLAALNAPGLDPNATEALRNLVERCVRYAPDRRPTAADLRRLCQEFVKRLPRGTLTPEQYAEQVVEPLYRARTPKPPIPIEGTLDRSGVRQAGEKAAPAPAENGLGPGALAAFAAAGALLGLLALAGLWFLL